MLGLNIKKQYTNIYREVIMIYSSFIVIECLNVPKDHIVDLMP